MTEYQAPITRPRVVVEPGIGHDEGTWTAWCRDCLRNVYRNSVKTDVADHARYHRDQHRAGHVPVVQDEQAVEVEASMAEDRADRALRVRPHGVTGPDEYDPEDDHLEDA